MYILGEMIDSDSYIPATSETTSISDSERHALRKEELIRQISSATAGRNGSDGAHFSYDDVMKSLVLDDNHDDDDKNDESDADTDDDKIDSKSNIRDIKNNKTNRLHSKSHMKENEEFVHGETTLRVRMAFL